MLTRGCGCGWSPGRTRRSGSDQPRPAARRGAGRGDENVDHAHRDEIVGSNVNVNTVDVGCQLDGGRIEALEKVRTASKGIARLEEIAVERAGTGPVDVAVHHLAAGERAAELAERLRERVPGLAELHVSEVGAVIGAHTGPGLLGVVLAQRA